jgi:NADPH2:quinone reductase
MQTIQVMRFGGPDVLEPNPGAEPVAGAGQALVAVEVADVLTLDAALRAGDGSGFFDLRPPYVPGGGVAGRVLATGDARDTDWDRAPGRRPAGPAGRMRRARRRPGRDAGRDPRGPGVRRRRGARPRRADGARAARGSGRPARRARARDRRRGRHGRAARAGPPAGGRDGRGSDPRGGEARRWCRTSAPPGRLRRRRVARGGRRGRRRALRRRPGRGGRPVGRAAFAIVADGGRFSAHGAPSGDFAPVAAGRRRLAASPAGHPRRLVPAR